MDLTLTRRLREVHVKMQSKGFHLNDFDNIDIGEYNCTLTIFSRTENGEKGDEVIRKLEMKKQPYKKWFMKKINQVIENDNDFYIRIIVHTKKEIRI